MNKWTKTSDQCPICRFTLKFSECNCKMLSLPAFWPTTPESIAIAPKRCFISELQHRNYALNKEYNRLIATPFDELIRRQSILYWSSKGRDGHYNRPDERDYIVRFVEILEGSEDQHNFVVRNTRTRIDPASRRRARELITRAQNFRVNASRELEGLLSQMKKAAGNLSDWRLSADFFLKEDAWDEALKHLSWVLLR
jgi:hypothetical protein